MSNMKKIKEIDEVEWNKEDSGLILPKTNDLITRIDTRTYALSKESMIC